ncbi:LacI family DNA-binding transcriptional regulator [uncultured Victivallis sp.]|uniref:LacI family DNA-binding transcriptional regulator n=1 Tax=uncultured Victivallis sp. TaxID=354118 RepID=UPI0025CC6809|nr:LacI family DNA-binding transcriptional regulator [uncultured Victivallis sp.]
MARHRKEINIKLVAEEAGVSLATVSRVINNRTDVSEEVRRRVSAVVEKFNFAPTKGSERRFNIGVIVVMDSSLVNEYISQVLDGIADYSDDGLLDVTVIFYRITPEAKPLLQLIRERRCDAVVLFPVDKIAAQIPQLIEAEIPTMLINGKIAANKIGYVNNESYDGAIRAMEYLAECGHRKIGFLCNALEASENHQQRLQAYHDVMARINPDYNKEWIIPHQPTNETPQAGYNQCCQLLKLFPEVTAIFCTNDEMAIGAIKACWDANLRVPEDISIIGFDDIPYGRYLHPALTTVKQPLTELGFLAIKSLDEFLKERRHELPTEMLETELIIRESVARIRSFSTINR